MTNRICDDTDRLFFHLKSANRICTTQSLRPVYVGILISIIYRDVVYNLMLFEQRRELHISVAKYMEEILMKTVNTTYRYHEDIRKIYELLILHWNNGGVADKAALYRRKLAARSRWITLHKIVTIRHAFSQL